MTFALIAARDSDTSPVVITGFATADDAREFANAHLAMPEGVEAVDTCVAVAVTAAEYLDV